MEVTASQVVGQRMKEGEGDIVEELSGQLESVKLDEAGDSSRDSEVEVEEVAPAINVPYVPKKLKGKRGKRIRLITNYVRVYVDNKDGIFQYNVSFVPNIENLQLKKHLLSQFEEVLQKQRIFDGRQLFLPFKLPKKKIILTGTLPDRKSAVKVTVQHVRRKPYREMVPFFNVLIRRIMTVLGQTEKRKDRFFDLDVKFELPRHKLRIWPGICINVEEQEEGLMLCLDTSYRVFRTDTIYEYMCALMDMTDWKSVFKSYLLNKVVVTTHNSFTYRIDDVDWDRTPLSTFEWNGKLVSYAEYYERRYNIQIHNLDQPLLLSRLYVKNGDRGQVVKIVSIIPELTYVCGMDDEMRQNEKVLKEVKQYTYCTPAQKVRALNTFLEILKVIPAAQEILKTWGVRIESKVLEVEGRQLPLPVLEFQDATITEEGSKLSTSLATSGVFKGASVKRWLIICCQRDVRAANKFQEQFVKACNSQGIQVPSNSAEIVSLKGHSPQDFRDALEDYADPKSIQFVLVVMPFARRETYSVIKTVCCLEIPLPSQIVLSKTLTDITNLSSVVKNLALQINTKLGGSPWGLRLPSSEKIMFVGIDVNHDVKKTFPSVVALIASMNNSCTQYCSKVRIQRIHQEVTDNMQPLFSEALECFKELNGSYPDRIIVFRDGGSLSMMPVLVEHEVKPMLAAIRLLCPELQNFTYLVVSKRVPQRLFIHTGDGTISNPAPGSVVDSVITYPNMLDFYIVSQQKNAGVINPTHYMVIYDIGGADADFLQQLAYSTTYMYFNWCGTIRVPAMVQYAHKLSALVGQSLRQEPSAKLETSLYYL